MPDDDLYSLTELADLGGVTPRTVRYYLAQGLLPAVGQSGPGSKYGSDHLTRLRLIRRLQAEHLPLAEIRRRLDGLSGSDIRALVVEDEPPPPTDSALDYLRTVLDGTTRQIPMPTSSATPAPSSVPAAPQMARSLLRRMEVAETPPTYLSEAPASPAPAEGPPPAAPPTIERSQWERIAIAPDVELHIRRPLTRAQQKGIDRLVTIARELLEEDRS